MELPYSESWKADLKNATAELSAYSVKTSDGRLLGLNDHGEVCETETLCETDFPLVLVSVEHEVPVWVIDIPFTTKLNLIIILPGHRIFQDFLRATKFKWPGRLTAVFLPFRNLESIPQQGSPATYTC